MKDRVMMALNLEINRIAHCMSAIHTNTNTHTHTEDYFLLMALLDYRHFTASPRRPTLLYRPTPDMARRRAGHSDSDGVHV